MKYFNILPLLALLLLGLSACEDQIMEWRKDPSHGDITNADLPLKLAEKIARYEVLKNYADYKLGAGIGLDLYMSDPVYAAIVNENFDDVTVGYAMKHAAMVNAKGEIMFEKVDPFVAATQAAGLTLYGHTLVWHANQNASYLNSLLAPTVIPATGGGSALDIAGLKDGSFTGWARNNVGAGISIVDGAGLSASAKAVQLVSSSSSANAWSLQLATPDIPVVSGHKYEVSFYIKSDKAGKGRISFSGLANNYPHKDWYSTGGAWTEAFETTSQWQQVKFTVNDFSGQTFKMNFDLGYLPDVAYLIDVNNIRVVDLDAPAEVKNSVANGKFDTNINGWSKWNGAADANTWVGSSEAYEGAGAMKVINLSDNAGGQWKTQIHSDFTEKLEAGKEYTISYMVRSEATGSVRVSTTGSAKYQGDQATSPAWKLVEWKITADGGEAGMNFDLGLLAGTYYIDNVVVTSGAPAGGGGPTIIEKTEQEKKEIVAKAMRDWIVGMVSHYKDHTHAWDVVNEPMLENGTLRTGIVNEPAADDFYWVRYLGKDYAVEAFKLARQHAKAGDVLFINDYNLESRMDKTDGLIQYVQYIESQGATVDGIGTQMHISTKTDKALMVQMFQKLAASGKKIKITELDVRLGTNSPTAAQLAEQAAMYQYVLDKYRELIPEAQRYGVTIWGVSDHEKEHEYWLPNESPNLWDAKFQRKHAYKGVADGLAGRDVSAGFSGDLVP